jgi:hypothetical protein
MMLGGFVTTSTAALQQRVVRLDRQRQENLVGASERRNVVIDQRQ